MYLQTFEEYLEKVDKKLQWILLNGKKIASDDKNKIAFAKQDEINQDVILLNERYVITKDNINKDLYELFVSYSISSNRLYNSLQTIDVNTNKHTSTV